MSRLTSVVLPAPVGPTMATVSPGVGDEAQVVDERLVGLVAERDVLEGDRAARLPRGPSASTGSGDLLGLVEELEDALGGGDRRLEDVGDARGLDDRERELARVLDERDDVAQRHLARRDAQAADDRDRDVVEVRR